MSTLTQYECFVDRHMRRGEDFHIVEQAINSSDLDDPAKSALWLLAWSYLDPEYQRQEARAHLREPSR